MQFICSHCRLLRETRYSFLIGVVAVTVAWASVGLSAEDPARFLSVTDWRATVDRTASTSGHRDYLAPPYQCSQDWTVSEKSMHTVLLPLNPQGQIGTTRIWQTNGVNPTMSSSIQDSFHELCVNPMGGSPTKKNYTAQISTQFPSSGSVGLTIDAAQGTYTLKLSLAIGYRWDFDGQPGLYQAVIWLPPDGVNPPIEITRPLPDSGMTLAGTLSIPLSTAGQWGGLTLTVADVVPYLTGDLVLTWNLTPSTSEVELEVEIKDAKTGTAYENWLPTGNVNNPQPSHRGVRA